MVTDGRQATRAAFYRAWRRRGHTAMPCLRVVYGPRFWYPGGPWRDEIAAMVPDLGDAMHEVMCPGCVECVQRSLSVIACDQTFGIGIGPEDAEWVLLVAWRAPFGKMQPEEALDLCASWLLAGGWRPDDGPEKAAEICDVAKRAYVHEHAERSA